MFRWFFPGVFCESVVFTEVRRRSRVLAEAVIILVTEVTSSIDGGRVCNREVTWIFGKRPYSDGGQV